MSDYTNHFVDLNGRTYRVAFHRGGRAMIVVRQDHTRHDTGRPLILSGRIARAAILKAGGRP